MKKFHTMEMRRSTHHPLCFAFSLLAPLALGYCIAIPQASAAALFTTDSVIAIANTSGLCAGGAQHIVNVGTGSVPTVGCSGATFSETAAASAQYGALRALADLRFNNFNPLPDVTQVYFEAKAQATIVDSLVFSQGAFWQPTVSFLGTAGVVFNGVDHNLNPGWCFSFFEGTCWANVLGTQTFQIPIPANHVLDISPTLSIDLLFQKGSNQLPLDQPLTEDFYVDLSHTVTFLSSRVLDANGQPISDATISSASGYDWQAAAVPLPTTAPLMALGIAMLAGCARLYRTPMQDGKR